MRPLLASPNPPWRERLVKFYQTHNPGNLHNLDEILQKYAGREEDLFRKLEKKYGLKVRAGVHTTAK